MQQIFCLFLSIIVLASCGSNQTQSQIKETEDPLTQSVKAENGMGQHYSNPDHPVVRFAVLLANNLKPKKVLEFATGRGLVASALLKETSIQFIHATDIHGPWIRTLQKKFSEHPQRAKASILNAGKPIPKSFNGKFDMVVAKDLYPFLNPIQVQQFIKNASNALKSEGLFVFSFPVAQSRLFRESIPTEDSLYRRLTEQQMEFIQTTNSHFSFATEESISNLLEKNHFTVEKMYSYGRSGGWTMVFAKRTAAPRL